MNIALIGPPGAGKGTQSRRLAARLKCLHLSITDLFRTNLQKQTSLGRLARGHMADGDLVPDELVDAMLEQWLKKAPPRMNLVFEGYPRTAFQAETLAELFRDIDRRLDAVVYLDTSDEEALRRLEGRVVCGQCLVSFSKSAAWCHQCPSNRCYGEHLHAREEDQPTLARERLRLFHRGNASVLRYYQEAGRLLIVPGDGSEVDVEQRLVEAVQSLERGTPSLAAEDQVQELRQRATARELPAAPPAAPAALDLILVGAPGSGKGTRALMLSTELKLPHIATGDLFRDNLKRETPLGKMAKVYMDRGELVPDDVTDAMVQERLGRPDSAAGFILDGYPRNLHQAEALDESLQDMGRRLAGVLYVAVSDEEILARLTGRLTCRQCQAPFHLRDKPPAQPGVCDRCGGELYQRQDDNPETIGARLKTFHAQTAPVIEYYRAKGLIVEVPGSGEVAAAVNVALEAVRRLLARR
jgi:adenylate kinase